MVLTRFVTDGRTDCEYSYGPPSLSAIHKNSTDHYQMTYIIEYIVILKIKCQCGSNLFCNQAHTDKLYSKPP